MTIEGLPSDETAEIVLQTVDGTDTLWSARTVVETGDGTVNLDEVEPVDGDVPADLTVPTTMALTQLITPEHGDPRYTSPDTAELQFSVIVNDDSLGSTRVDRMMDTPDVEESRIAHDDIVGTLYEPQGNEPTPAAITLHGSDGNPMTGTAALLASHGFTAVALTYFGVEDLPQTLSEIPLSYVETAIDWLLDHDRVENNEIGLHGISRGGELALLAGSEFDTVGSVVSINGSAVVWDGTLESSAWVDDGEPVPSVPPADHDAWGSESLEPAFSASIEEADEEELTAATIPVEEIDGSVLLVSGGDDALWPSVELHEIAVERFENAGHDRFEHRIYDEAGHTVVPPYWPVAGRESTPGKEMGGTPTGYAEADADFWPRAIETLRGE